MQQVIVILVNLFQAYLLIGFVFGIAFLWKGARVVDPLVKDTSWAFKLLILPGSIALWPILLTKWIRR